MGHESGRRAQRTPTATRLGRVLRRATSSMVLVSVLSSVVALPAPHVASAQTAQAEICGGGTSTRELNAIFSGRVTDYNGMDSLRAFRLPDGRTLWLMQDSFLSRTGDPGTLIGTVFAHNVGLLQQGSCFLPLHGPTEIDGKCGEQGVASYVGGVVTDNCVTWFWPMGGAIGADGALHVFFANMINLTGRGAAAGAAPEEVWVARIDVPALTNVPVHARALVVTLVAVQPTRAGWMTAAPCAATYGTAALNADAWRTVANLTIAATRTASGRDMCVHSLMPAHQVVDLVGWYTTEP